MLDFDGKQSDGQPATTHVGTAAPGRPAEQSSAASPEPDIRRRVFLGSILATLGGLTLWSRRWPHRLAVSAAALAEGKSKGEPKEVKIVRFSDAGERLETVRVPKVIKTDAEWRQQLSENSFEITRHEDTEVAYSGKYWNLHDKGIYRCICCDNALFKSSTKFDSGTGWPSFWAPIAQENVREIRDVTFGMVRTAIACTLCDAHLGHVFDDGPEPTHLRYCMNSASLRFVAQT
jgi:peptide-methionine (R)-S-oxide reductase